MNMLYFNNVSIERIDGLRDGYDLILHTDNNQIRIMMDKQQIEELYKKLKNVI